MNISVYLLFARILGVLCIYRAVNSSLDYLSYLIYGGVHSSMIFYYSLTGMIMAITGYLLVWRTMFVLKKINVKEVMIYSKDISPRTIMTTAFLILGIYLLAHALQEPIELYNSFLNLSELSQPIGKKHLLMLFMQLGVPLVLIIAAPKISLFIQNSTMKHTLPDVKQT